MTFWPDTYGDGIPFGLPTEVELAAEAARRRRFAAGLGRRPWPGERPNPYVQVLAFKYPDAQRLAVVFALARDVEACADLLAGRPVDRVRLDPVELDLAQEARHVRLVRPIDELDLRPVSDAPRQRVLRLGRAGLKEEAP